MKIFLQNIKSARSNIVFIIGVLFAAMIIAFLSKGSERKNLKPRPVLELTGLGEPRPAKGKMNAEEFKTAQIAWQYFKNNIQNETGFVNSVDGYPSTTMWDQATYLLALITMYRLELIEVGEFNSKMSKVLNSLLKLPLFDGKLPNKVYNTKNLAMTDYKNQITERGLGWSAIDIARILVPFTIITWHHPEHGKTVHQILEKWQINAMLKEGVFYGARINLEGKTELVQEGRLGYEEYAARAIALLGYDGVKAISVEDFLKFENIEGQEIAVDTRDYQSSDGHNYVVSEPYVLTGFELGFDAVSQELSYRIYRAQEERFKSTGIMTAVSEDNVDQEPFFIYNTVFSNGKAWNAIDESGKEFPQLKSLSTKIIFGWLALYDTKYARLLHNNIQNLYVSDKGWYSGQYESDQSVNTSITANSNGIILESLHYKQFGPLLRYKKF